MLTLLWYLLIFKLPPHFITANSFHGVKIVYWVTRQGKMKFITGRHTNCLPLYTWLFESLYDKFEALI